MGNHKIERQGNHMKTENSVKEFVYVTFHQS